MSDPIGAYRLLRSFPNLVLYVSKKMIRHWGVSFLAF